MLFEKKKSRPDDSEKERIYPNMFHRDEFFFRLGVEKSEKLLRKLKEAGNPDFQDDKGFSYLHRACQAHYYDAIKILLEKGADPNIKDNRGFSPVLSALGRVNEQNSAILELMLQYGLDLDQKEGNQTLREIIVSFKEDALNQIVSKYYKERI